jgi:HPt (histidine-containing phosphotransfer) domain-containing protein
MEELERLRREYAASLPEKTSRVSAEAREVVRRLQTNAEPNFTLLEQLVHKLAGSSGVYGFMAVSALARRLEDDIATGVLAKQPAKDATAWLSVWVGVFETHAARAARLEPEPSIEEVLQQLKTRSAA